MSKFAIGSYHCMYGTEFMGYVHPDSAEDNGYAERLRPFLWNKKTSAEEFLKKLEDLNKDPLQSFRLVRVDNG